MATRTDRSQPGKKAQRLVHNCRSRSARTLEGGFKAMGKLLRGNLDLPDNDDDESNLSLPYVQLTSGGRAKVVLYGSDQSGGPGHPDGTFSTSPPTSTGAASAGLTINISWDASIANAPVGFTDVV